MVPTPALIFLLKVNIILVPNATLVEPIPGLTLLNVGPASVVKL